MGGNIGKGLGWMGWSVAAAVAAAGAGAGAVAADGRSNFNVSWRVGPILVQFRFARRALRGNHQCDQGWQTQITQNT